MESKAKSEIINWMEENKVNIAAHQEIKLMSHQKDSNTANFTLVREDRDKNKGRCLALLVHKTIVSANP